MNVPNIAGKALEKSTNYTIIITGSIRHRSGAGAVKAVFVS